MEEDVETTIKLEQLFRTCDRKRTGFIVRNELRELCSGLGIGLSDSDTLFADLDRDGDGKIDFNDFVQGFRDYVANPTTPTNNNNSSSSNNNNNNNHENIFDDSKDKFLNDQSGSFQVLGGSFSSGSRRKQQQKQQQYHQTNDTWKTVFEHINKLSSTESISATKLQELQVVLNSSSSAPQLASCFEDVFQSLVKDMQRLQKDNERLEEIYKNEKEKHENHLRQIEEEIDAHVQKVEEKLKEQMKEESENEIKALKLKMDSEMSELQSHLKIFQTFDSLLKKDRNDEEKTNALRSRLDEAAHENRKLRMTLTDTQTNIALMHSELAHLRSQYEEKCRELHSERENSLEYIQDQDHMTRQLQLLQCANKRMQDANDSIRIVMDNNLTNSPIKSIGTKNGSQPPTPPPPTTTKSKQTKTLFSKRGSIIGDYLRDEEATDSPPQQPQSPPTMSPTDIWCVPNSEVSPKAKNEVDSSYESFTEPLRHFHKDSSKREEFDFGIKRFMEDLDSGLSTSRDQMDFEEEENTGQTKQKNSVTTNREHEIMEVISLGGEGEELESMTSGWAVLPVAPTLVNASRMHSGRHPNILRTPSKQSMFKHSVSSFMTSANNVQLSDETYNCFEATGPPDRMYKVVFAGDAAVGKTTFIVRISKGFFVSTLTSTLGVDFHVKTFRVDEKNVSLQLWDTAGQERFRSVTKSYFRRADGVMLLYDCTSEHSFLNVRDWMHAIDDVSEKRIPIMLCANKIDIRETALLQGKSIVRTDDGERLARDFSAIFIETSAKSGKNVVDALIQLTREMASNEDLEVQTSGLRVTDLNVSKKTACCGK